MKVKTVITGVGAEITALIKEGRLDNKGILEKVRASNPVRKTSYACVAWYQSKLRKEKEAGKEEVKAAAQKAAQTAEEAKKWEEYEVQVVMEAAAAETAAAAEVVLELAAAAELSKAVKGRK